MNHIIELPFIPGDKVYILSDTTDYIFEEEVSEVIFARTAIKVRIVRTEDIYYYNYNAFQTWIEAEEVREVRRINESIKSSKNYL